ncbi:hypothetical protein [Brevundimonas sp.]|uniref:hypothetical protein n=1 Tax=Brevundimonas sp. TaxID=1871086 RepID=UPI002D734CFD|nr:hypothetical protein [Brevundimonas sp.]HYC99570.1 hypothetical protein [Brevundimonas sp.]
MRLPQHSYEEVRDAVVSVLLRPDGHDYPSQFLSLVAAVGMWFHAQAPRPQSGGITIYTPGDDLHPADAESVREVFWDLFRQGHITLGLNNSNPAYPFFRLSRFGRESLGTSAQNRFHDTASYIHLVQSRAPDLSPEAATYLEEAVAAFYAGCYLSACVMIGVAAESEFLRLTAEAAGSTRYPGTFAAPAKETFLKTKIDKFQRALEPIRSNLEPRKKFENLDANLAAIQAILRVARNDAGHPTGAAAPDRDQVYVFLHLFPAFAEQVHNLRLALA